MPTFSLTSKLASFAAGLVLTALAMAPVVQQAAQVMA